MEENRRYDIYLKAKDKEDYSAIIEIKPIGTEKAADDAMQQINDKTYSQELLSEGYSRVLMISLAVDWKNIVTLVG